MNMSRIELLSRRAALKGIGVVAASATGAHAQVYKPQDQLKLTKKAAHYQDAPFKDESCASCPYFVQPKGCVTVEGDISPTGWCPMYTTFSVFDRGAHCSGQKSC
jgi:hypothetical protein